MHETVKNLLKIQEEVKQKFKNINNCKFEPKIIAVSKTFNMDKIMPLIKYGHKDFGENRIQEAEDKWAEIRSKNLYNLNLHLIGKLQSNKVKPALKLFNFIHSLDSEKLANKLSKEQESLNLKRKYFIQVNIGDEKQKSGISKKDLIDFVIFCKNINLDIIGLMCIPPIDKDHNYFFSQMRDSNQSIGLQHLSMGMSNDFKDAINYCSTYIRIGTNIFGKRD